MITTERPGGDGPAVTGTAIGTRPSWWPVLIALLISGWSWGVHADAASAEASTPAGPFTQAECLACHATHEPSPVGQWRAGPHRGIDCIACHGAEHGALPRARDDAACTACHDGVVAHSYQASKHGALVTLERPGWEEPLQRASYRAPGCAYCHLHAGDHGDSMDAARGPAVREWICGACHAPRFVRDQFAAGEALLAIGRLKSEEADAIAARHPQGPAAVSDGLASVQRHLRNLRLGAGHQSPDYQWWHGQPALDGDLIRLRDAVARAQRESAGDTGPAVRPGLASDRTGGDPEGEDPAR